jgi:DNA-binding IclR family transcriptional regulator
LRDNRRRASGELPLTTEALSSVLESVRATHVATRRPGPFYGDQTFANAVSVPILAPNGRAVLALTAIGPAAQFDAAAEGSCAEALKAAAREISAALGEP